MNGINIVTANFSNGGRQCITRKLFQYDYGQKVQIKGLNLPQSFQVHISNTNNPLSSSSIFLGKNNEIEIPDEFLISGEDVYIWIFLHQTTNDGETRYTINIPVQKRPKIENKQPTPVEKNVIDQLISSLEEKIESVSSDDSNFDVFLTAVMNITPGYREGVSYQFPSDFASAPDKCLGKFVKEVPASAPDSIYAEYTQIVGFYRIYEDTICIVCANSDIFQYTPTYSGADTGEFSYVPNEMITGYVAYVMYTIENGVKTVLDTQTFVKNNSQAGYLIGKIAIEEYDDIDPTKTNRITSRIVSVDSQIDEDEVEHIKSFTTSTGTVYTWNKTTNKFVATLK